MAPVRGRENPGPAWGFKRSEQARHDAVGYSSSGVGLLGEDRKEVYQCILSRRISSACLLSLRAPPDLSTLAISEQPK
jgi:hypothetical protein